MNMKRLVLIFELSFLGTLPFQTLLSEAKDGVSGRVTHHTGYPIPGVSVTLNARSAPFSDRSVVTNEQGRYFFDCVPEGTYELVFKLAGFLTEKAGDFYCRYPLHLRVDQVMNVGLPVTDVFYLAFR